MTHLVPDRLERAIERLESALRADSRGCERSWATEVSAGLADAEHAIRVQLDADVRERGPLTQVTDVPERCPTRERQARSLLHHEEALLEMIAMLTADLQNSWLAMRQQERDERQNEVSALGVLGGELVDALRVYRADQARTVLDAVNTEMGAGD